MDRLVYEAHDESETACLGRALADVLPDGTVVALCGPLGAGKTRLVQALAEACGVDRRAVTSPSFVLVQQYRGRRVIYHIDAYRLRDADEFWDLGVEEYFASEGLVLVEWADRVAECLPPDHVTVQIEVTGDQSRRFEVRVRGTRHVDLAPRLKARLSR